MLCVVYVKVILDWGSFAWHSDLYSHALLIPLVAVYLVWNKRGELVECDPKVRSIVIIPLAVALGLLTLYFCSSIGGIRLTREDRLCIWVLSFLGLFYAAGICLLGQQNSRILSFPALFLVFAAPFPSAVFDPIESFLQQGSTLFAHALFWISGTPFIREGTFFQLPGMLLNVAPECSGIHSSLVLFITSILAGHFLLKSHWMRMLLAVAVIPLALLRNGFRIFTIGQLCIHIGPEMINSPIHRRGGPIFFVLSLVPFFLFLLWLVRRERQSQFPGRQPDSYQPGAALGRLAEEHIKR